MKVFKYFLFVLLIAPALFFPGEAPGQSDRKVQREKVKLEDVNKKIKERKKEIKKVKKKEARIIENLDIIEKKIIKRNREYDALNNKIKMIQDQIKNSRLSIESLTRKTKKREQYLKKRMVALYKYYKRSGLKILLSSTSYNDFLKQEKFLADIVTYDHDVLNESQATIKETKKHETELIERKNQLLDTRLELSKKRNTVKEAQGKKLALLKKIKYEKKFQTEALKELEKYSRELQTFVDRLPKDKKKYISNKKFSKMKGQLRFPVKGEILTTFGKREHPDLHTYTFQKGIEIEAQHGTEIKAIFDGRVVFADWFKGYGYLIIIDHGESYYSLAAHASKLLKQVDDIVLEGEPIAHIGDTNSLMGAGLYFEIRHHGKPQNPLSWLKKGGNKT